MPVLSNPRHERFAQFLAQGKTAVDAYELAGYKRHDGPASILARHPEVKARLEEILGNQGGGKRSEPWGEGVDPRRLVTPKQLIQLSKKVYHRAFKQNQHSAAIGAIREMGVLSGHRIEKREVGPPDSFDHLTDDELERALFERLKALGWAFDGAPLAISAGSANGGGGDEADEV